MIDFAKKLRSIFKYSFTNEVEEKKITIKGEIEKALKESKGRPMVYLGDFKALTENIFGHSMILDTRDTSLTPHLITKGFWEIWITQVFLESIEENMNFLEIGANVGYYTLLAASRTGKNNQIFAFEADANTYGLLSKNLEINGFIDKVITINKAVYSDSRKLSFSSFRDHHGSNSVIKFPEKTIEKYRDKVTISEVNTTSIDEFFEKKIPEIGLIKIDAEGCEPQIFRGMVNLLDSNPSIKIICEFAQELIMALGEDPEVFLDDLEKQGFSLNVIDPYLGILETTKKKILSNPYSELFLFKKNKLI
jgi:FkbM family methyltransferase